jgi:hypothetical protein
MPAAYDLLASKKRVNVLKKVKGSRNLEAVSRGGRSEWKTERQSKSERASSHIQKGCITSSGATTENACASLFATKLMY